MNIAIIGAGFSGLACAWKLIESKQCQVTVFDSIGVGGGASGVASGLMHPYVGEQVRRSEKATEGIQATRKLLSQVEAAVGKPVARYEGIVRIAQSPEQRKALEQHAVDYGDVESLGEGKFWIRSGVTVHCQPYLEGLWKLIESHGGRLIHERIETLDALSGFDQVVIAAGFGITQFKECSLLKLKCIKGQILSAMAPIEFPPLRCSLIGKGYVAVGEASREYHLGATYEREFISTEPCLDKAKSLILPKIGAFFPESQQWPITGCKAGIRVMRHDHYFPILEKINNKCWVFTALGSRGLLFHALLAEQLSFTLLKNSGFS